jgi:hypothetical protein
MPKSTSVAVAVLLLATLCPPGADAQSVGVLAGTVTDRMKQPLPGVRVTVAAGTLRRTAVTEHDGRYAVPDLPAGSYAVIAELPGFETVRIRDVAVASGSTTALSFTLEAGCLQDVHYVDSGFATALRDATAILRLRIIRSGPSESCRRLGVCACTDHIARVTDVLKAPERLVIGTIRFVQEGVSIAAGHRDGGERPHAPGEEYVAFLRWDSGVNGFLRYGGPGYMFPVRDGRVEFRRTDAPGMFDGMAVEEFSLALRALLAAAR